MRRSLEMVIMPDAPQMLQAVEAFKRYHEAGELGAPPEEIERLKFMAESMLQTINDYRLRALGRPDSSSRGAGCC